MNYKQLRNILEQDGYSKDTINSIMCGRRKPNPDTRFEYLTKYLIPFQAWGVNIKSYLQGNDNTLTSDKAIINE